MRILLGLLLCLLLLPAARADHVVLTERDLAQEFDTLPAAALITVTGTSFRHGNIHATGVIRQAALSLAALEASKAGKLKLYAAIPEDLLPKRDGFPVSWSQLLAGTSGVREASGGGGFIRAFPPGRAPDDIAAQALLLDRAATKSGLRPVAADRLLPALLNETAFRTIAWQPHPLAPGHAVALRERDVAGRRALMLADAESAVILFPDHGVALLLRGAGWRDALSRFVAAFLPPRKDWPRRTLTTDARAQLTDAAARHQPDGDYIADADLIPDSPAARLALWPGKVARLDRRADGAVAFDGRDWAPLAPLAWASGPDRLYAAFGGGLTTVTLAPGNGAPRIWYRGNVLTGAWLSVKSLATAILLLATGLIHLRPGTDATLRRCGVLAGGGALLFGFGFYLESRFGVGLALRVVENFALTMALAAIIVAFRLSRNATNPIGVLERIHVNFLGIAAGYLVILGLALGIAGSFSAQTVFF